MKLPNISRRAFLQVSAGTGAAAAVAPRMLKAMENDLGGKDFGPVTAVERRAVPTGCHVCNIQDGAIAFLENDRVVKLEGNPEHVSTRGRLCAKGNAGMWYSYDPDRILYPLKRVGARGEGKWKRISWDEALTELVQKLDAALKEDPNTVMMKYGRSFPRPSQRREYPITPFFSMRIPLLSLLFRSFPTTILPLNSPDCRS